MATAEFRDMTLDQLDDQLARLKKEQFNLRFQRASGQLEKTSRGPRTPPRYRAGADGPESKAARRNQSLSEQDKAMPKRVLQGVVVSDKNDKTRVVKVERRFTHPVMKKTVRRTKKYHAHDEHNQSKEGDQVWIEETAPISKLKRWVIMKGNGAGAPH